LVGRLAAKQDPRTAEGGMSTELATNSEIISDFQNLQPEDVQKLSDREFVERMKNGVRTFSKLLQPFAEDFFRRFKESKKRKETFLGYKDLDRAAVNLTGYTARQLRNIAKGTPTPKRPAKLPKPLVPEEQKFREARRSLQEKVDAKHEAEARERELSELESELVATPPAKSVTAIVVRQHPVVPEVAKRDAQNLDEAIRILNLIVFAVGATATKKATKTAIQFLKSIGEFKAVNN
jgi:hypothetical protein